MFMLQSFKDKMSDGERKDVWQFIMGVPFEPGRL